MTTPYRTPAKMPAAPAAAIPSPRLVWIWRVFAFSLCWALRLRVEVVLNLPADRLDLVAAAWLDLQDQLRRADVIVYQRGVWISYSGSLFLRAWRA